MDQFWIDLKNQMMNEMQKSTKSSNECQTTQTRDFGTECPLCHGRGWVFINDNTVAECECGLNERERQAGKLRFASIPQAYKDVKLKDFTTKPFSATNKDVAKAIINAVKFWLEHKQDMDEQGRGLYFWSKTKGCGKTMLATALANELVNNYNEPVKFATSLDILDAIKKTFNRRDDEETEDRLFHDLTTVKYLVIDDFGTERVTDWVGEKFYQIVNHRYINKKVTFFTSNHDLKSIDYDDRITSRIRERAFLVHFPEESVREVIARQEDKKHELQGVM